MRPVRFIWLLLMGLLAAASVYGAASVKATLDRGTVIAGETVGLQVIVENGTPQSAENFPPVAGLSIQHQGNQRQFNNVNGVTSFKFILSYAVTALQPGEYQIPAIRVVVDGANYTTQPLPLTVTKSDLPTQNRDAFVRLLVPKTNIYVGEIIPIEVQLYVTAANNLQAPQLNSDGFVIHKQAQHTQTQSQFGQTLYNVVSFKMSVSAAKAGKLNLGPAEMNFDLLVRRGPDPNDPFGFFNRTQRRPTKAVSPAVEMNVLPLPANAPADFTGAIGNFKWTVDANPKALNAGDPITLRVVVAGVGNLDNLKLPEFNWPDYKFYPPNATVEASDILGMEGTKTFEQVVIPQSMGVREVPPVTLAYFDPAQKAYVKLTQPAIPLQVRPSTNAPAAVPTVVRSESVANDEPAERTDIVHIKMETGPLAGLAEPVIARPWFLIFQGLPLVALAGFTLWRKRQDDLARNPRLRRRMQVRETVRTGLADLRRAASANDTAEFYSMVFRLLQEQLGERLDLPASAITEAVLDERLAQRGAAPELIERLHGLFRLCNQARYAPVQTNAELLAIANELEKSVQELQQLPD